MIAESANKMAIIVFGETSFVQVSSMKYIMDEEVLFIIIRFQDIPGPVCLIIRMFAALLENAYTAWQKKIMIIIVIARQLLKYPTWSQRGEKILLYNIQAN